MVKFHDSKEGIFVKINNVCCIKVAGFDLDHTLIQPKKGRRFPIYRDDWQLLYKNEIPILKQLVKDGYRIVIFTNQGGILKKRTKLEDILYKLDEFIKKVGIPMDYVLSYKYNTYRKPNIGMWQIYKKYSKKRIFKKNSFYCGDAAGRKNDFSDSDKKFAKNIGIEFYIPEKIFM